MKWEVREYKRRFAFLPKTGTNGYGKKQRIWLCWYWIRKWTVYKPDFLDTEYHSEILLKNPYRKEKIDG
jgi:hypothetical protein